MTIIVAVKFSKGVAIATDSRVTYGDLPLMRDMQRKIDSLNDKIAITTVGLSELVTKSQRKSGRWQEERITLYLMKSLRRQKILCGIFTNDIKNG